MQHDLGLGTWSIAHAPLAPVVADGIGKEVAVATERRSGDGGWGRQRTTRARGVKRGDWRVAGQPSACDAVPEVEGAV